jgi:hypothetical protein
MGLRQHRLFYVKCNENHNVEQISYAGESQDYLKNWSFFTIGSHMYNTRRSLVSYFPSAHTKIEEGADDSKGSFCVGIEHGHSAIHPSTQPSVAPQSFCWTLAPFFQFLILCTVGRTPWKGINLSQGLYLHTEHHKHRIKHKDIHVLSRTHERSVPAGEDGSCLRPRGHSDRQHGHHKFIK